MGGCGWRGAGTSRGAGAGRCRAGSWTWARPWRAAIARELGEELCVEADIGALVGVYSHADKGVLVIVFEATLQGTPRRDREAPEVRAFAPDEIPWDELAFPTDEAALRDLLAA